MFTMLINTVEGALPLRTHACARPALLGSNVVAATRPSIRIVSAPATPRSAARSIMLRFATLLGLLTLTAVRADVTPKEATVYFDFRERATDLTQPDQPLEFRHL